MRLMVVVGGGGGGGSVFVVGPPERILPDSQAIKKLAMRDGASERFGERLLFVN